jgi:diguanylate cyclase (GGDEF)-like protein
LLPKPVLTPAGKKIFSFKFGQFLLALIMLGVISVLIIVSFGALQSVSQTRETLLAEESDASALVFVQRESFGLIIEIEEHLLGQSPIQDVLLARSTLAQRLNVITSTGQSTFTVSGEKYRTTLGDIDKLITKDKPLVANAELRVATDAFLTQARLLTDIFQQVSRANIQSAVESQAILDLWQGVLSLISLVLGALLFLWIAKDLRNGFKAGYAELVIQSETINTATQNFLALEALENRIAHWNIRVAEGDDLQEISAKAKRELDTLTDKQIITSATNDLEFDEASFFSVSTVETRQLLESRLKELISQIQQQIAARNQLEWERDHCPVTGLLNRRGMSRELAARLQSKIGDPLLLFDIDIDGFTGLNNAMGQDAGDKVLVDFANRLTALDFPEVRIARVAADQFVMLIPIGTIDLNETIQKVVGTTRYETLISGNEISITSCIGWHITELGETSDQAATKVSAALRAARTKGQAGVVVQFSNLEHGHLLTEYLEQISLRIALASGEVIPFLQPIVNLATRQIQGYEALARWVRPGHGIVMPDMFLPTIVQGGLLDELFEVMLAAVAQGWSKFTAKNPNVYIGINVDPKTLELSNFAEQVINIIKKYQVDPNLIVFEITEQSLLRNSSVAQLKLLRALGIRISLDDFGIGYSNLSRISTLPIDILKLDRSFLSEGVGGQQGEILRTIRQLAMNSNLKVVVEGIESEDLAQELSSIGFESGQGYLFGKPQDLLNSYS